MSTYKNFGLRALLRYTLTIRYGFQRGAERDAVRRPREAAPQKNGEEAIHRPGAVQDPNHYTDSKINFLFT